MTRRTLPLIVSMLALVACGPSARIETDVQKDGVNVFYGVPAPSPAPSLPPIIHIINPVQSFPTPIEQPPVLLPVAEATPSPAPTPTPPACPVLSPLAFPEKNATPAPLRPPAAGVYPFRHSGTLTMNPGTATQKVVTLPDSGTREVRNVSGVGSAGDFSFEIVDTFNHGVTTTSYHVYPAGVAGTLPATNGVQPGAYVTNVVTTDDTDPSRNAQFQPLAPGVEVFPFPASPGATWSSSGTDPLNSTTEVVGPTADNPQGTGTVSDHVRVNACGTPIDAWEASADGQIVYARQGPSGNVTFKLTVDMATQYGGLIVSDHLEQTYTDQQTGTPEKYVVSATINVVPATPPS